MRSALISNAAGEVPEREDWFLQSTFFTLTVAQCLGVHDSSVKLGISPTKLELSGLKQI